MFGNKKITCLCYNLWAKKYQVSSRIYRLPKRIACLKFQKKILNLRKYFTLKFSSPPNFRGVHTLSILLYLYQNCQHQIIFTKFNLTVHYLPSYGRKVWYSCWSYYIGWWISTLDKQHDQSFNQWNKKSATHKNYLKNNGNNVNLLPCFSPSRFN